MNERCPKCGSSETPRAIMTGVRAKRNQPIPKRLVLFCGRCGCRRKPECAPHLLQAASLPGNRQTNEVPK